MTLKELNKIMIEMKQTGEKSRTMGDTSISLNDVVPPNICVGLWSTGPCLC